MAFESLADLLHRAGVPHRGQRLLQAEHLDAWWAGCTGPDDPRRNGAFTIFYMGINLGAVPRAARLRMAARMHYGFHYGFAAAGVGMVIGLMTFLFGQKRVLADVEAAGNTMGLARPRAEERGRARARRHATPALPASAAFIARFVPCISIARWRASFPIYSAFLSGHGTRQS